MEVMMSDLFIDMLRGDSNTLGRTVEVVELVKKDPKRINELFNLYFQDDEWVRLRTSNALKRLWRENKSIITPFVDRWVSEVSCINQPSVNWTFAQMVDECRELLSEAQLNKSIETIKGYLEKSDDWIVLNASIQVISTLAKGRPELTKWLIPKLEKLSKNSKKSVATRASKALKSLQAM